MPKLRVIILDETHITDFGAKHLIDLQNLGVVSLNGTQVGEEGLAELARLPKLYRNWLENTNVTDNGARKARIARPKLAVNQ